MEMFKHNQNYDLITKKYFRCIYSDENTKGEFFKRFKEYLKGREIIELIYGLYLPYLRDLNEPVPEFNDTNLALMVK